jgi:hypothetical protein
MASKNVPNGKKRKAENGGKVEETKPFVEGFESLALKDIQNGIRDLCTRIPDVPVDPALDPADDKAVKTWAAKLQAVIEEFNLLLCCISAATYKWGSERSGAADQHLNILSAELSTSQDQISSAVVPRLNNVLAPVVDLVVDKIVISKEGNSEVRQNVYTREHLDPEFMLLCRGILCRNAKLLRQVCMANFHKIYCVISDYLTALESDGDNDARGFSY